MTTFRRFPLAAALFCLFVPVVAAAQDFRAERERWVAHSRGSDAAMAEAVEGLRVLYAKSKDAAVRADLTALLIRSGRGAEALAVCADCAPEALSAAELENLGKAARDAKQFPKASTLYRILQTRFPDKKIGWLGSALVAVDMERYPDAAKSIEDYTRRFGKDKEIQTASDYLAQRTQSPTERFALLQNKKDAAPDRDSVISAYRAAGEIRAYPVQANIMAEHAPYFTETDRLWLKKSAASSRLRNAMETYDYQQLASAYRDLGEVMAASEKGGELYISAWRDRIGAATALGRHKEAVRDYRELVQSGEQPDYVREHYAAALLQEGSPNEARRILGGITERQLQNDKRIDDKTNEKLIKADADLMHLSAAKKHLNNWNSKRYIPDFAHRTEVENPYYSTRRFWEIRLEAWAGNSAKAGRMMKEWLAERPADPWALALKGELAKWNNRPEDAVDAFARAKEFMAYDSHVWLDNKLLDAQITAGNWRAVKQGAAAKHRDNPADAEFWKSYDEARAPELDIRAGMMKATQPEDGTEWSQQMRLYSGRTSDGHRAYIAEQSAYVPNQGEPLRHGRVGLGTEISLYPATVNLEAGRGFQLNDKAYAQAGIDYRLNGRLKLNAAAAFNSANTPAKALNQNVYADEYTVGAQYTHSTNTGAGIGAGLMRFDDGNKRQTYHGHFTQNLFQYNRWKLNGTLWADYTRNKNIPAAHYYNPKNSKTFSGTLTLSHTRPFDNHSKLTQELTGGAGRYWQHGLAAENTWLLKYGHKWQFGRRFWLDYEAGRRQAMYDGRPEFENFGNLGLKVKFK